MSLRSTTPYVLRAVRPCVNSSLCYQCLRNFSISAPLHAARPQRQAPSVRKQVARDSGHPASSRPLLGVFKLEDSLPSITLLNSAHKSGALNLKPDEAIRLTRAYFEASQVRAPSWEQTFIRNQQTTPQTLTLLGQLLNRCTHAAQRSLGKQMLLTASAVGHADATLVLLVPAHRNGSLQKSEYAAPLAHLMSLARNGENVQAMVLQGRILQDHGKEKEALRLFEGAAKAVPKGEHKEIPVGVAEAVVYSGLIFQKRGDKAAAEAAFRKAAIDMDNPAGYFHLAKLQDAQSSSKEVYLLKAAGSGILDATYELGILGLEKAAVKGFDGRWLITQNVVSEEDAERAKNLFGVKSAESAEVKMAKEWLHLGAMGGHGHCMCLLAEVLLREGNVDDAKIWLEAAEGLPYAEVEAGKLKSLLLG